VTVELGNPDLLEALLRRRDTRSMRRMAADRRFYPLFLTVEQGRRGPLGEGGDARKLLKGWCALHDSNVRPTDS
jgi:hypothetical protein